MTDDTWQEVVAYILKRLETESEFDADKIRLFETFGLTDDDELEFMDRRAHLREKYFEMKTVEHQSRSILVFSRLGSPS